MSHRERVRDFWDEVVNEFLDGGFPLPEPLDRWILAYQGGGDGAVDREAFPEPYGGPIQGDARGVMLGLNPGVSYPAYQHRHGILAQEIRTAGRYSQVFRTHPVNREPWLTDIGPVGYLRNRVSFMRRWLEDESLNHGHLLTFELFPWHSKRVTRAMQDGPVAPFADWIAHSDPDTLIPGTTTSLRDSSRRYLDAVTLILGRPERVVLVIAHAPALRWIAQVADGRRDPLDYRRPLFDYALPSTIDVDALRRGVSVAADDPYAPLSRPTIPNDRPV